MHGGLRTVRGPLRAVAVCCAAAATLGVPVALAALAGDLDTSFQRDGIATTSFGPAGGEDVAYAIAIQPADGKIVLAGRAGANFGVVRYNPNGGRDTTFSGDGRVAVNIRGVDHARAVVVQPNGKIVAAGYADDTEGYSTDFALVRLNSDGGLDTSFSGDGKVRTHIDFGNEAHALVRQPDGKLVAAGWTGNADRDFALVRYNADGTLDDSFDGDGKVVTPISTDDTFNDDAANAVVIQSDGKLVAAGYTQPEGGTFDEQFALVRYDTDGTLDDSFDGDGKVVTPFSTERDEANALVALPNDKLAAAGSAEFGDVFALARYLPDGTLDSSFGGDGKVTTQVSPIDLTSVAYGLARQAGGKLVAVGRAANAGDELHQDFGAARYGPRGGLDTTFGGDGKVVTSVAPDPQTDFARAVAVGSDGKIVVGGYADMGPPEYVDYSFTAVRYHGVATP